MSTILHQFNKIHDFDSLIWFLRDSLRWPIPEGILEFDEITFDWSAEYLNLRPDVQARIIGCRQLRIFDLIFNLPMRWGNSDAGYNPYKDLDISYLQYLEKQPWGIFFVEFENNVKIDSCTTLLRQVLRNLVGSNNHLSVSLPFWNHDRLLFACTTTDFKNIGFVRFIGNNSRPIVDNYIPLNDLKLDAREQQQFPHISI